LNKIEFKRIAILPSQVQEYQLKADFETGDGYEIDALNAFNPTAFKKLLLDHIIPYFDEDIHNQILEAYSAEEINDIAINRFRSLAL
jgi:hypothetical protein